MSGLHIYLAFLLLVRAGSDQVHFAIPVPPPSSPSLAETLHLAVRAGNREQVETLLRSGLSVDTPDALGSTPLLDAAWAGNPEMVGFLLGKGADPNARHREAGTTPLQYAVLGGNSAVVKLLLAAGARTDVSYRSGHTLLGSAAGRGYAEIVAMLLQAKADLNAIDAQGNTALDQAVREGRRYATAVLLARGADAKAIHQSDGRGALHEAAIKGSGDLIDTLIAAGADPLLRDNSGQTPLDLALAYKNSPAVTALLHSEAVVKQGNGAAEAAMETATLRGQVEIARTLLDAGFDVNKPTPAQTTYLHDAALKGQVKMVRLLLEHGARVEALNSTGGTPLHDAALGGNAEVIELLLDHGSNIDALDQEEAATPLMLAASFSRSAAIEVLLKRGANAGLKDRLGRTALARARSGEDHQTILLLQRAGIAPPHGFGG